MIRRRDGGLAADVAGTGIRISAGERGEPSVAVERLAAGQRFHREVQDAFLTGSAGGQGFRELGWRLVTGSRARLDLAVEVDGAEPMLVIIEIKGTDWDKVPAVRVRRNVRRHLRQLQAYLDTAAGQMNAGQWAGGIAGALSYPARPASAEARLGPLTSTAGSSMCCYPNGATWQPPAGSSPAHCAQVPSRQRSPPTGHPPTRGP